MDKLDLILENLEKIDVLESKIDKMQCDITALKSNNKLINNVNLIVQQNSLCYHFYETHKSFSTNILNSLFDLSIL